MKRIALVLLAVTALAGTAQAHPSHHRHYIAHHHYRVPQVREGYNFWSHADLRGLGGYAGTGYARPSDVVRGAANFVGGVVHGATNIAGGIVYGAANFANRVTGGPPGNCRGIAWCGCWLRDVLGIPDRALNSALAWARYPATSPHVGAVVVWNHGHGHGHVGLIVGGGSGHWLVQSGNDG